MTRPRWRIFDPCRVIFWLLGSGWVDHPTCAYFWPEINEGIARLWPGYSLTQHPDWGQSIKRFEPVDFITLSWKTLRSEVLWFNPWLWHQSYFHSTRAYFWPEVNKGPLHWSTALIPLIIPLTISFRYEPHFFPFRIGKHWKTLDPQFCLKGLPDCQNH